VNGSVSTVEMFGSAALFGKLREKLLRSAASEAVTAGDTDAEYDHPADADVQAFITAAGKKKPKRADKDSDTFIEHYHSSQSDMFKTYHLTDSLHTAIYSADKNTR
jgi:ABC-type oligopeptide transport system ATPase subunit